MKLINHFIQKMADKYNPSIGGAIVLGIIYTGMVATPVAGVAAVAGGLFSGASGALWGAGLVTGAWSALCACMAVPHYVQAKCYEHRLKRHIAAGGSPEGYYFVPGVSDSPEKQENLRKSFNEIKSKMTKPGQKRPPQKPPQP